MVTRVEVSVQQLNILFQAQVVLVDIGRMGNTDIAEGVGVIGNAGLGFFSVRLLRPFFLS